MESLSSGERITRRTFLGATGLAAVAVACGNDGDSNGAVSSQTCAPTGEQPVTGSIASNDVYVGSEQRFAFGVVRRQENGDEALVQAEQVLVAFAPACEAPGLAKSTTFHADGLEPGRGIYVTYAAFDQVGNWEATISVGELTGTTPFEVKSDAQAPKVGDTAIPVKTPTVADPAGVDPICTRTPACPFHAVSLDEALAADLPVVVMFSTPAYCVSRTCGPVLELMVEAAPAYEGRAAFVHVEVWKDRTTESLAPGMDAWLGEARTEPWAFGVGTDDTIVARLDGAFDRAELVSLIEAAIGEAAAEAEG